MAENIEKYKSDLQKLIKQGQLLYASLQKSCFPREFEAEYKKAFGDDARKQIDALPSFDDKYQEWYSEAKALIKLLLPDRLLDFIRYYEKPKTRKEINYDTYTIEDCLIRLRSTRGYEKEIIVDQRAALPKFEQQLAILSPVKRRFESSLFDIQQLMQANLFDTELDKATELLRNRFTRASGALTGVVLEHHLLQVCHNHSIKITKKNPCISDLDDQLKNEQIIELAQWRNIQYLGDIRNLCDHDKQKEPTEDQVNDLIEGTKKIVKNLF